MIKKRYFLALVLSVTLNANTIDMKSAWEFMKDNSSSLKASKSSIKRSESLKEAASSLYLPTITLNASYTHLEKPIGFNALDIDPLEAIVNSPTGVGLGLPNDREAYQTDLSQQDVLLGNVNFLMPLYMGGKISSAIDIKKAAVKSAEAKAELLEYKTFLNFVKRYYGVVMAKSYYETRQEVETSLREHYEHSKSMQDEGQLARVEVLSSQVKLEDAILESKKAKNQYELAQNALRESLHLELTPSSKMFINEDLEEEEFFKHKMMGNFAGLKYLDSKTKQADAFVSFEQSAYMPKLVAFGNFTYYKDDSLISKYTPDYIVGARMSFTLLDSTGRGEKLEAARLLKRQSELVIDQAQNDLSILVDKVYKEMIQAVDEYKSLQSSLELAKENKKLRNIAFSEGLSTSLEVVDANLFLASIETKRLNAQYTYLQRLSKLLSLSGDIDKFFELEKVGVKDE